MNRHASRDAVDLAALTPRQQALVVALLRASGRLPSSQGDRSSDKTGEANRATPRDRSHSAVHVEGELRRRTGVPS